MTRPIRLFLVRHAVSAANLDRKVNIRLPDSQVPLADGNPLQNGHLQADAAGKALSEYLLGLPDFDVQRTRILCSPYVRTRQTSAAIEKQLRDHNIDFDRREELALREISFGLFDGIADEELPKVFPAEHAHYQKHLEFEGGEFYARMPMGESRVEVADRVKTVFGTILRDASPSRADRINNFIIVSHGVTLRAFQMQWLHETPEWYESQKNPLNASVTLIESDGETPYQTSTVFAGFPYHRTKQEKREEGKVE